MYIILKSNSASPLLLCYVHSIVHILSVCCFENGSRNKQHEQKFLRIIFRHKLVTSIYIYIHIAYCSPCNMPSFYIVLFHELLLHLQEGLGHMNRCLIMHDNSTNRCRQAQLCPASTELLEYSQTHAHTYTLRTLHFVHFSMYIHTTPLRVEKSQQHSYRYSTNPLLERTGS